MNMQAIRHQLTASDQYQKLVSLPHFTYNQANMFNKLSTEPYKGTRDLYPEDMAVQQYMFNTWSRTAELYGFERYDASILEPAELYRSKTSEEIVNEQTYTFIDRGKREVTLRPEMTPTAARMVARKRRELSFPLRWYSIPNLFRYERPQRGRLREHWQLNCDIFGSEHYTADVEIIALAHSVLASFGATDDMFEIRINDRSWIEGKLRSIGLDDAGVREMFTLLDKKEKIDNFEEAAEKIVGNAFKLAFDDPEPDSNIRKVMDGLKALGIENVKLVPSVVRGFEYYTGTVFEVFDTSPENNRSILGGGRYDNLTAHFGGDAIPGVGFGMGDVTMRDFLETHGLLTAGITAPTVMILPTDPDLAIEAEKIAQVFRENEVSTAVDMSDRKIGKKISAASDALVEYVLVLGEDEIASQIYTLKNLADGNEKGGDVHALVEHLSDR